MKEDFKLVITLPVDAKTIYEAWLDSDEHSKFTGGKADIEPFKGGRFTAGDSYIHGKTIQLQPYSRIVQSWRTTDFPDSSTDSIIEILLEKLNQGTRLTLVHSEIPEGQSKQYQVGWEEHYFKPMIKYFSKKHNNSK